MSPKSSRSEKKTDAVAILKSDHRLVEGLFKSFKKAKASTQKSKIAQQICMELAIHTAIEEEMFYPASEGEIEDDLLNEAYVEHDGAKLLIAEIMAGSTDDRFYDAKVKVLSEAIKHHVKEEEQRGGMFAQAKKAGLDLAELGQRMAARKKELKRAYSNGGLPALKTRTLKGAKVSYDQPLAA